MSRRLQVRCCFSALVVLILGGCASEAKEAVPTYVIDEARFVQAYADVHILEASIKQKLIKGHDSPDEIASYYEHILERYDLDQSRYDSTRIWYANHPEAMQHMVELAMERIAEIQADEGLTPEAEEVKVDSTKTGTPFGRTIDKSE